MRTGAKTELSLVSCGLGVSGVNGVGGVVMRGDVAMSSSSVMRCVLALCGLGSMDSGMGGWRCRIFMPGDFRDSSGHFLG